MKSSDWGLWVSRLTLGTLGWAMGLNLAPFALSSSLPRVLAQVSSPPPALENPSQGISLRLDPPAEATIANGQPVQFTLDTRHPTTQTVPLDPVTYAVTLTTPPKTPWFTTDFPIVEGTDLLRLETTEPDAVLTFSQVLPIRGTYTLKVQATLTVDGRPKLLEQSFQFQVPEQGVKYRNGLLWAGGLLVVGFLGGWVIRHQGQDSEGIPLPGGMGTIVLPQGVRLLLTGAIALSLGALVYVNVRSEFGHGHGAGHGADHGAGHGADHGADHGTGQQDLGAGGQGANPGNAGDSQPKSSPGSTLEPPALGTPAFPPMPLSLYLAGETQATVGQLSPQQVQVSDPLGKPAMAVPVRVESVDLEHDRPIFTYTGITDRQGQISWQNQFFDGAPHLVTATLAFPEPFPAGTTTTKAVQPITVIALAPPLSVRLISLAYLMAFFGVGLGIGLAAPFQKFTLKKP